MKWWEMLPKHAACCDAANDAHVELAVALRKLEVARHEARVLDLQLAEQIKLNDHLIEFLSVLGVDGL